MVVLAGILLLVLSKLCCKLLDVEMAIYLATELWGKGGSGQCGVLLRLADPLSQTGAEWNERTDLLKVT